MLPFVCTVLRLALTTLLWTYRTQTNHTLPHLKHAPHPLHVLRGWWRRNPRLNTLPLCESGLADLSQLQHVTPLPTAKAAVYPLRGFLYCLISNEAGEPTPHKPESPEEARLSSCAVHICLGTTRSSSRLLLKENRLALRKSPAAWRTLLV